MEYASAGSEEIEDVLEGAVIQRLEFVEVGARIFLKDGRVILIPDAEKFFVCSSKDVLQ